MPTMPGLLQGLPACLPGSLLGALHLTLACSPLPPCLLFASLPSSGHSLEFSSLGHVGSEEGALEGHTPAAWSRARCLGQEAGRHISLLSVHFHEAPLRVPLLVPGLQDSHWLACLQTHFMAASGHKGVHCDHLKHLGSDKEIVRLGRQTDPTLRGCPSPQPICWAVLASQAHPLRPGPRCCHRSRPQRRCCPSARLVLFSQFSDPAPLSR